MKRTITVELTEQENTFIKWLAKRDGIKINEELQNIFNTELMELIDYFKDEYDLWKMTQEGR